jgi:hypothetical protein
LLTWLKSVPGWISQSWAAASTKSGGFLTGALVGWAFELVYGLSSAGLIGGVRIFCLLWFASGAAFFVGTIAGFLFGVPKARLRVRNGPVESGPLNSVSSEDPNEHTADDKYRDNTNLEEVSDWLTKIIVGLGLVEFNNIITFLGDLGDKIGVAIDPSGNFGGNVIGIGSLVIGFATGFLHYYVWARMILRRSLENP